MSKGTEEKRRDLVRLFGPLENLTDAGPDETAPRPMVTNVAPDGTLAGESDLRLLNLLSNFIWHTDNTFPAMPSISNILIAYRVPSNGGEQALIDADPATRAGLRGEITIRYWNWAILNRAELE